MAIVAEIKLDPWPESTRARIGRVRRPSLEGVSELDRAGDRRCSFERSTSASACGGPRRPGVAAVDVIAMSLAAGGEAMAHTVRAGAGTASLALGSSGGAAARVGAGHCVGGDEAMASPEAAEQIGASGYGDVARRRRRCVEAVNGSQPGGDGNLSEVCRIKVFRRRTSAVRSLPNQVVPKRSTAIANLNRQRSCATATAGR